MHGTGQIFAVRPVSLHVREGVKVAVRHVMNLATVKAVVNYRAAKFVCKKDSAR